MENQYELHHLVGGSITEKPPIFTDNGNYLLFLAHTKIKVFSPFTGQCVRQLEGNGNPLIDMALELGNEELVSACTEAGELFIWSWKTGLLQSKIKIAVMTGERFGILTNYHLLNWFGKSQLCYGFICQKITNKEIKWHVIERSTGKRINIRSPLKLGMKKPLCVVDRSNFPNLVLVQGFYVYFVNYKTWKYTRLMNAYKVPITVVQIHPREELVATGDEMGRIFLWRNFYDNKTVCTTLYHWHHTMVTSICFTPSGANFYSGGQEAVLVNWKVDQPAERHYLPRMVSRISHIVVNPNNTQVAVSMVDNGVQIIGTEKKVYENLQEFTYIADDKTGKDKFPVGLLLNPRTNTVVLNGRTGCLQFYNTHTKTLLYNLNVVNENLLSMERNRILYDTRVTKAAFNIDWMVTGEVFNDEQRMPEVRLKFWFYQEENRSYTLNTCIELPHEGGFKAIEFSNRNKCDNLLCATAGEDDFIKMWYLDESNDIYRKGKTWYCAARTRYLDNQRLGDISFSQDGSLLAAGYGSMLCVYRANDLQLRTVLSSTGRDGVISKLHINISASNETVNEEENFDSQIDIDMDIDAKYKSLNLVANNTSEKLLQLLNEDPKKQTSDDFIEKEIEKLLDENNDCLEEIDDNDEVGFDLNLDFDKDSCCDDDKEDSNDELDSVIRILRDQEIITDRDSFNFLGDINSIPEKLLQSEKSKIFDEVMKIDELRFIQKLMVFQRLGIYGSFQNNLNQVFCDNLKKMDLNRCCENIENNLYQINHRERYKEALRFYGYSKMKDKYDKEKNRYLMPLFQVFTPRITRRLRRGGGTRNYNSTHNSNFCDDSNNICKLPATKKRKVETLTTLMVPNQLNGDVGKLKLSTLSTKKEHCLEIYSEATKTGKLISNPANQLTSKSVVLPPTVYLAQIRYVEFCHGTYSDLIICCTERRILLWNILTLKMEAIFYLTVKHLCFDTVSSLLAVVTKDNQLIVFSLDTFSAVTIQENMPELSGMQWIPRNQKKNTNLLIDWQAKSTLYLLTNTQEIKYFVTSFSDDEDDDNDKVDHKTAALMSDDNKENPCYSTFGTIPSKIIQETKTTSDATIADGPLIVKKTDKDAVKTLIEMSIHTMPSASRIRNNFIEAMIQKIEPRQDEYLQSSKTNAKTSLKMIQQDQRQDLSFTNTDKSNNDALCNGFAEKGSDYSSDSVTDELSDENNDDNDDNKNTDSNLTLRKTILTKESELNSTHNTRTSKGSEKNRENIKNIDKTKSLKHLISIDYNFDF